MPDTGMQYLETHSRPGLRSMCLAAFLALTAGPAWTQEAQQDEEVMVRRPVVVVRTGQHNPGLTYSVVGQRSYLGVQTVGLTSELREHFGVPEDAGVLIARIMAESPAAESELKVGDIITKVNGDNLTSPSQLARAIGQLASGEVVDLEVWRQGTVLRAQPTLAERQGPWIDIRQFGSDQEHSESLRWTAANFDGVIELETETLNQAIERLNKEMDSPEWHERVHVFQQHQGSLMKRIEELEERLQELEAELQQLPEGD